MQKNNRRFAALAAALLMGSFVGTIGVFAEDYLSANDLPVGAITTATKFEAFTINARADKGITIEAMEDARTADDGEVFNARIKLNGGGAPDFRSIVFPAKAGSKATIYLNSSSKTDARTLKVTDMSGAALADLVAPPDGTAAGIAIFDVLKDGEYVIFSAGSGINVYQIVVE